MNKLFRPLFALLLLIPVALILVLQTIAAPQTDEDQGIDRRRRLLEQQAERLERAVENAIESDDPEAIQVRRNLHNQLKAIHLKLDELALFSDDDDRERDEERRRRGDDDDDRERDEERRRHDDDDHDRERDEERRRHNDDDDDRERDEERRRHADDDDDRERDEERRRHTDDDHDRERDEERRRHADDDDDRERDEERRRHDDDDHDRERDGHLRAALEHLQGAGLSREVARHAIGEALRMQESHEHRERDHRREDRHEHGDHEHKHGDHEHEHGDHDQEDEDDHLRAHHQTATQLEALRHEVEELRQLIKRIAARR